MMLSDSCILLFVLKFSIRKLMKEVLVYLCNFIALHIVFFTQMNLTCFLYVLCVVAVMCPLYYYHQSHPINLVLLGLFTVAISLTVGIVCALTEGMFF